MKDTPRARSQLASPYASMMVSISLLFIVSCASNKANQPSWVITPKQDTGTFIYGIGQGDTLALANFSALKNITTKLGLSISGTYKQRSIHRGRNDDHFIDDNIKITINNTSITTYQSVRNQTVNERVYSMIKVDKSILLDNYKHLFNKASSRAAAHLNMQKKYSDLVWWLQAKQITTSKSALKAQRYSEILRVIDPFHELELETSPWKALQARTKLLTDSLCFSITTTDRLAVPFVGILKSHVTSQEISLTPQCEEQIRVSANTINRLYYGMFVTRHELLLTRGNGEQNTITLTSQSPTNFEAASQSNLIQLKEKLEGNYLWKTLGIITQNYK